MRRLSRTIFAFAVAGLVGVATATIAAQGAPAAKAPTTPPDLSGIWGPRFVQSLAEDAPLLPAAEAKYKAGDPNDDPIARCEPPGIPRLMNLAFPFEIVQTPKVVYILFEYDHFVRRVFIGGTHPADLDPMWLGHSIGHWDGGTLVVDSVGFREESWLDMRGHPHTEQLHVIERFTRSEDGKSLKHEVTIDDPGAYTKPWPAVTKSHQLRNEIPIEEFVCQVG